MDLYGETQARAGSIFVHETILLKDRTFEPAKPAHSHASTTFLPRRVVHPSSMSGLHTSSSAPMPIRAPLLTRALGRRTVPHTP
jgi:hypothetical protein